MASPLIELLAKNVPFMWGEKQEAAFVELKEKLSTTPILQINFEYDFTLEKDTSIFAIEAVLM